MLAGIDDLKLDSTASNPSSSHSLPHRVICHPETLRLQLWVVWFYSFSAHASFTSILSISVGRQSVSAVSEPSVSAVVLVTARYGANFGYGRNQKKWFRSVSSQRYTDKYLLTTSHVSVTYRTRSSAIAGRPCDAKACQG